MDGRMDGRTVCGHKIDHNSSSRPPFDIKNSTLDRIFHAQFADNSFKASKQSNKAIFIALMFDPTKKSGPNKNATKKILN